MVGPIVVNCSFSSLLDILPYCYISIMNWELPFADGSGTTTKMVPTDNEGHILIPAIYGEFVEVFSKAKVQTLVPHQSIDRAIDYEPGYNLPYGWFTVERMWVQWSLVQWSWVDCSGMVFLQLPVIWLCAQKAGWWIWTWIFHAIWTDHHVGIFLWWMIWPWNMGMRWRVNGWRKIWRAAKMTFDGLTELPEKSRNAPNQGRDALGENEWPKPEMDCSQRWITAADGSELGMDHARRLIVATERIRPGLDTKTWITTIDRSQLDIDPVRIWILTRYGWMSPAWISQDGWWETDNN